ncbi:hypothetical protein GCM10010399_20300 [Dactylosporangium fulvum]|uniref:Hsp20/alpha crystallin family protein n=1 Tax=Dactylosporangium fulvum TaxID=53359 RepID=A0ABY5W3Y2_9ACTN|nr:Hsp20/alpha crystallin family protein [Dactylosporangium fulvum]UWP84723.1 Hsp20/alpha crystallin family protein [Dactylosporangium fulvum]
MTILVSRPRRPLGVFPSLSTPGYGHGLGTGFGAGFGISGTGQVPVDIEETEDAFLIDLDLPNVRADDLQIELRDNEIRVFGKHTEKPRTGTLRHHARRTGEFEFLIALPGDVDPDGVDAELDNGVLSIRAPKVQEALARRIEVHQRKAISGEPSARPAGSAGSSGQTSGPASGQASGSASGQGGSGSGTPGGVSTPAAQAKQMKEGQSRPGSTGRQMGSSGTGSSGTGQVGRSSMA